MARVVKWIKSPWAIINVNAKSPSHSYNSEPIAQTKNTLPQLVMEKPATNFKQLRTDSRSIKGFALFLSNKWKKLTVIAMILFNL